MKIASTLLTSVALAGILTVWDVPLKAVNPSLVQALAADPQNEIDTLIKHKGQIGSGDELRRYFYGDLEPIGIQPGGAGMVVNLYNKTNDITFSYCTTYDVIVAVKKGKISKFSPSEVK